ncbi:MAG TPA: hypothetical protein VMW14_01855 [Candidatus Paceibacterota bacterium]|nr:hypothetical protein [Candidatus Paceibacterota bacterium]
MPSKKKRRNKFDEMFGSSALDNADSFKGSATGYSISVVQTDQGTKVRAKVGKDTNVEDMRKQLKQKYPNAEIEIKGSEKKPLIR